MTARLANLRDIDFVLYELLQVENLLKTERYERHSRETFDMAIAAACKLAREAFWPAYRELDRVGAQYDPKTKSVTTPEVMKELWAAAKEGGWFGVTASYEEGGQQYPATIGAAVQLLFNSANTAAQMYVGAAHGAALLVSAFGDEKLKADWLEKFTSGEWTGTMALTEPQAAP